MVTRILALTLGSLALLSVSGCGGDATESGSDRLTLGVYTTPREAYGRAILPAFRRHRLDATGRDVVFRESYLASGAQARAIVGGFEADVALLSLEPDIETLRAAGLVRDDWSRGEHAGIVTRSVVVIGVREGNPRGLRSWRDLARPGVEVLTPNARTSGGAMWNILAVYGAAMRGHAGSAAGDRDAAIELLASILANVRIMDRSGRDSMLTFERGVGDAIITYENEILVGRSNGQRYDYVVPESTILIENPAAVVDAYADRHGTRELARAFVEFLWTPEAQRAYAEHGLRPVDEGVAREVDGRFPSVADLFTIRDLGGWAEMRRAVFDEGGVYERALARWGV